MSSFFFKFLRRRILVCVCVTPPPVRPSIISFNFFFGCRQNNTKFDRVKEIWIAIHWWLSVSQIFPTFLVILVWLKKEYFRIVISWRAAHTSERDAQMTGQKSYRVYRQQFWKTCKAGAPCQGARESTYVYTFFSDKVSLSCLCMRNWWTTTNF